MSLQVRNTRDYTNPDKFRFVGMIYGGGGCGKTEWVGTCDPATTGIIASDYGEGAGLLTIANKGFSHIIPENMQELEEVCGPKSPFKDMETIVIDPISALARTVIKDTALKIPQNSDASRQMGVPSLRDYGVIGALTSGLLNRFFRAHAGKHLIVTATEKWDKPGENDPPGTESLFGPSLAGALMTEAPAMFDFVFRLRTRSVLKDPKDAKSRFLERYFQTDRQPGVIAKCRATDGKGKPFLDSEEIFDLKTGQGSFPYIVGKIVKGYQSLQKEEAVLA